MLAAVSTARAIKSLRPTRMSIIWRIFAPSSKQAGLYLTILLMILTSIAEVIGIASVAPFISYISTGYVNNPFLQSILKSLPISNPIVVLGAFSFVALVLSNFLQAATTYRILRFTWESGVALGNTVFDTLLRQSYSQHVDTHSSELLTHVLHDVTSAVANVLIPTLVTIARAFALLAILLLLIYIEWRVALLALMVAIGSYLLVFRILVPGITKYGKRNYEGRVAMYKLATETFSAITEIKVFSSESYFTKKFSTLNQASAAADAKSQMMRQIPKYLIETVAFGGMILIAIILATHTAGGTVFWPILSIYAIAAWRLLPAAQQIFSNITSIRHHWSAIDNLNNVLAKINTFNFQTPDKHTSELNITRTSDMNIGLDFDHVSFAYDPNRPIFLDFSLQVKRGEIIGIIGKSGVGKSTLLALSLGLLNPHEGAVCVFGSPVTKNRHRMAYVPQQPNFFDDTLLRNIALGFEDNEIDEDRIWQALKQVELEEYVGTLPDGLNTRVGERGINFSGGQRQRLALARALYTNPELLILDEFTSALDSATEQLVLGMLKDALKNRTTLIVTHRCEVLDICSRVIEL